MIVGRTDQLATLDQALDAAEGGSAARVLLVGEAGMGATTLLARTRRAARRRGFVTVAASAPPGEDEVPFALVHDMLAGLVASGSGGSSPGSSPVPEWRVALLEPTTATPSSMSRALHRSLAQVVRDAPAVVTADDLQWADDSSRATLALVGAQLADERVALVAATRPPVDDRFGTWTHSDCPPLSRDDAATLLADAAGMPVDPHVADAVTDAWGGCPQAIVECRRLLTRDQLAGREPLPDPIPLSEQLQRAWLPVLRALSPSARCAVTALSVLDTIRPELVSHVLADVGAELADIEQARRAGLLCTGPHGTPAVCSPLVRTAVLNASPPSTIRALHRQVADVAERVRAPVAVTVRHLARAGAPGDTEIADRLADQARRALARDQPEVAARALTGAADLVVDDAARRRELAVAGARVLLTQTTTSRGSAPLLDLLTSTELTPADRVWREWLRAEVLAETDLHQSACAAMAAAHHARDSHPALVTWLLWDVAATSWTADDPRLALDAARELDDWTRSGGTLGRLAPVWLPRTLLGAALLEHGAAEEGARLLREARRQSADWRPSERTPLGLLINVVALDELMMAEDPPRGVRLEELLLRLEDDRDATMAATMVLAAWQAARRGDLRVAAADARSAHELARAVRATPEQLASLCLLVQVQATTDPDNPGTDVARVRQLARRVGHHRALAEADRADGLRALAGGRVETAIAALEPVDGCRLRGRSSSDSLLAGRVDLVEAYVHAHRVADAAGVATDVFPSLRALAPDDPGAVGLRERTTALLDDDADADDRFAAAEDAFARAHDSVQLARTHLLHAQLLRRHRRPGAARAQARRAVRLVESLGADAWLDAAHAELACREHAAATTGHAAQRLTPQERRVAEAVSHGGSTREVAEALVLSPRTVEFHLANVYRKLGVHNRAQLANVVAASGAPHPSSVSDRPSSP
jgi:DNA-binding CsgD family transcriptional regulator